MILGIDASALPETRRAGARFTVRGQEIEPLSYAHDRNGCSLLRLRLWLNPYDEDGRPYGGGTNDFKTLVALAKEGLSKGYKLLLDFHYSDFWCDPAKQFTPKAWAKLSLPELVQVLGQYTRKTLLDLQREGIDLYAIQVGNEITNGMLWPTAHLQPVEGKAVREGYDALCALLKAGVESVKAIYPSAYVMLHLERSYDQAIYREFFDQMLAHKVDFDIIGMSYYPYWHGTFQMLFDNVDLMKKTYGKDVWIVETAYGFTTDDAYVEDEVWAPLVDQKFMDTITFPDPYPLTQEGQEAFIRELIRLGKLHGVGAIVYWEPFWLPLKGLCWATKEGEEYVKETQKPTHNEWANQCLFDYQGEATKAFYAYRID